MHTNLDIAENGVSETLCNVLELKNVAPFTADDGYTLWQGETRFKSADDFALFVKEKLGGFVRFVDGKKEIKKVLVCSGSGGDFLETAIQNGYDAFVTSEVKHHQFLQACDFGVSVFDAGHFGTEDIIVKPLAEELKKAFPDIDVYENHFSPIKYVK